MSTTSADTKDVKTSIFIAQLDSLSPPHHLQQAISLAASVSLERLVVVFVSPLFNGSHTDKLGENIRAHEEGSNAEDAVKTSSGISHIAQWESIQRLQTFAYVAATRSAQQLGRVLLDVDVLLRGVDEGIPVDLHADAVFLIKNGSLPVAIPESLSQVPRRYLPAETSHSKETLPDSKTRREVDGDEVSLIPVVALGGTFDHLHAGHKILLFMAAWIASRKLIVGMTDDALLKNKSNKHILEDLAIRSARVRSFLQLVRPGLELDVVSISDVAGPTGWDPDIQALVVSRETRSGAEAIHKIRAEKNLPPLRTFVIDVISATEESVPDDVDGAALREAKMSSTFIRQWIADRQAEGLSTQ